MRKLVYAEWIIPIIYYYASIRIQECIYEICASAAIAFFCLYKYIKIGKVFIALEGISHILPTVISILIGFTAMMTTVLLTSNSANIQMLKDTKSNKDVFGEKLSLYQNLHIHFTYLLFSEILLLLIIFFYLFCKGLIISKIAGATFFVVEIYLILNILLSMIRGITNLYFTFWNRKSN